MLVFGNWTTLCYVFYTVWTFDTHLCEIFWCYACAVSKAYATLPLSISGSESTLLQ